MQVSDGVPPSTDPAVLLNAAESGAVEAAAVLDFRPAATRLRRFSDSEVFLARTMASLSSDIRLTITTIEHVRLRILVARPRARGFQRFMVAPSSA